MWSNLVWDDHAFAKEVAISCHFYHFLDVLSMPLTHIHLFMSYELWVKKVIPVVIQEILHAYNQRELSCRSMILTRLPYRDTLGMVTIHEELWIEVHFACEFLEGINGEQSPILPVPALKLFRCPGCLQITTVFSHAQTVVLCGKLECQIDHTTELGWDCAETWLFFHDCSWMMSEDIHS